MKRNKDVQKHIDALSGAKDFFEQLKDTKQETFDNRSEKWQEGDKGQEAQEEIDNLDNLVSSIETAYDEAEGLFELD